MYLANNNFVSTVNWQNLLGTRYVIYTMIFPQFIQ